MMNQRMKNMKTINDPHIQSVG